MAKYYMAHNAGGRTIGGEQFEVTQIFAGTAIGVFEAKTEAQIEAMEKVAADIKSGVTAITQEEYDSELQKKTPNLASFPTSNHKPAQASIKGPAGVVAAEPLPPAIDEAAKLETVQAATGNTGKVEAPPKAEEPPAKKQK